MIIGQTRMLLGVNRVSCNNYVIDSYKLSLFLQNRDVQPQTTICILGARWPQSPHQPLMFGDCCLANPEPSSSAAYVQSSGQPYPVVCALPQHPLALL